MGFRLVPKSVILNGVMAIILRYFAEFGSFSGQLRRSGCRLAINRFSPEKCPKVGLHQLSTTDALCSSR